MCVKKQYSKVAAHDALSSARANRHHKRKRERRIYHCPDCGFWHLTSQPANFEKRKNRLKPYKRTKKEIL